MGYWAPDKLQSYPMGCPFGHSIMKLPVKVPAEVIHGEVPREAAHRKTLVLWLPGTAGKAMPAAWSQRPRALEPGRRATSHRVPSRPFADKT